MDDSAVIEQMRQVFNTKLESLLSEKAPNSVFITRLKYRELITEITQLKQNTKRKMPVDYHKLKRFDVLKVGDTEKLIYPVSNNSPIKFYVSTDELFDVIHDVHISIGHGGRGKMSKEINKTYKNVTTEIIMIYLHLCELCKKRFSEKSTVSYSQPNWRVNDNSVTPTEDDDSDVQIEQRNLSDNENTSSTTHIERRRTFVPTKKKIIPPMKKRIFMKNNKAYTIISGNPNERDEYSLFGEQVALKVRKFDSPRVRTLVQYAINTVLFEAEMGKYDNISTIPQSFTPTFNTFNNHGYDTQFPTNSSSVEHCFEENHLDSPEDSKINIINNLL